MAMTSGGSANLALGGAGILPSEPLFMSIVDPTDEKINKRQSSIVVVPIIFLIIPPESGFDKIGLKKGCHSIINLLTRILWRLN